MSIVKQMSTVQHEAFYQDLVKLMDRHAGKMDALAMLGIAANMVGKMIALQDQRRHGPDEIMTLVAKNIEEGNQQAIAMVASPKGRA
jgi:hypothetical protein